MKTRTMLILSAFTLLFASQYALADDAKKGPSGRKGPPPEAIEACADKSEGDSAEFEGRNGESITGICEEMKGGLVLRPDNPPSDA